MKGIRPTKVDPRDRKYHFHRLFGSTTQFEQTGITPFIYDQNADNRPDECSAYTITSIYRQTHGKECSKDYQYRNTLEAMGVPFDTKGADPRKAFAAAVSMGFLPKEKEPEEIIANSEAWAANSANWPINIDLQAYKDEPGYNPIGRIPGMDWFDTIRSTLTVGKPYKRTVGLATQWSTDFGNPQGGVLTDNPSSLYWGHMYEAFEWEGEYLFLNTWQGNGYGTNGVVKMSRKLVNQLMGTWGAFAGTFPLHGEQPSEMKFPLIEDVISGMLALIKNLILTVRYGFS